MTFSRSLFDDQAAVSFHWDRRLLVIAGCENFLSPGEIDSG